MPGGGGQMSIFRAADRIKLLRSILEGKVKTTDGEGGGMTAKEALLRWFNFHLKEAGVSRVVSNFGKDLADSECLLHLLFRRLTRWGGRLRLFFGATADHTHYVPK